MPEPQIFLEGILFIGSLMGIYVKLNSRIVKIESDCIHLLQAMAQERADRKEDIERLIKETAQDRKVFQGHAKETSEALHELGQAVHGLTVFLQNSLPEIKHKKKGKSADLND
jgi:hypothetical protein